MEPFDKDIISESKKKLKQIGKLSLELCYDDGETTKGLGIKINQLAHEVHELIWLEENRLNHKLDMKVLSEEGVPSLKQHIRKQVAL